MNELNVLKVMKKLTSNLEEYSLDRMKMTEKVELDRKNERIKCIKGHDKTSKKNCEGMDRIPQRIQNKGAEILFIVILMYHLNPSQDSSIGSTYPTVDRLRHAYGPVL